MGLIDRAKRFRDSLLSGAARTLLGQTSAPVYHAARVHKAVTASRGEQVFSGGGGYWFGHGASALSPWAGSPHEQVLHFRHWVYRGIDAIARVIAREPPRVAYLRAPGTRKAALKSYHRLKALGHNPPVPRLIGPGMLKKATSALRGDLELEEASSDHPLARLFANPNPYDIATALWYEAVVFLELTGSAYIWKVPNRGTGGPIAELWVIPSQWLWPRAESGRRIVDYYELSVGGGSPLGTVRFDPSEIVHVRYPSPLSKLFGAAPIQAAAEMVDVHDSVLQSRFYALKNGANLGTLIEVDKQTDPDDAEIRRFHAEFCARYQGETGFMSPAILPPGASVNRPDHQIELAFNQTAGLTRDDILAILGVPKNVAGIIDGVNRANNIAARDQFYHDTCNPKASVVSQYMTKDVAREYDDDLIAYVEEARVSDPEQTRADYELGLRSGAATPNEYRVEVLGLEDFDGEWGDEPILPANVLPATSAGEMTDLTGTGGGAGTGPRDRDLDPSAELNEGSES